MQFAAPNILHHCADVEKLLLRWKMKVSEANAGMGLSGSEVKREEKRQEEGKGKNGEVIGRE